MIVMAPDESLCGYLALGLPETEGLRLQGVLV